MKQPTALQQKITSLRVRLRILGLEPGKPSQILARVIGFGYPTGKGKHPESDANANLIAAAPELYEELERGMKDAHTLAMMALQSARYQKSEGFQAAVDCTLAWVESVRAALAKARGEG